MDIKFKRIDLDSDFDSLSELWKELASRSANECFFLSWTWIGNWVKNVYDSIWLASIFENGLLIGLALFGENKKKLGPIEKSSLWLNKTGLRSYDQTWIEYNDILFSKSVSAFDQDQAWHQLSSILKKHNSDIHIDLTVRNLSQHGFELKHVTVGFVMKLRNMAGPIDLLNVVSRNTRRQIKKSIQLLEEKGKLELSTEKYSDRIFEGLAQKHQEQWRDSEWGSGFDNPNFIKFHKQLSHSKHTKFIELKLEGNVIAYGYYLLGDKTAYFYLSAIEKHKDNRIKIGLAFHFLAMLHFQQNGMEAYDFLGGEARYKKSLSSDEYKLYSWHYESKNLMGITIKVIDKIKRLFLSFKKHRLFGEKIRKNS